VLPSARGLGIGKKMMEYALDYLQAEQVTEVLIHAQEPVRSFYLRLGFEPEGDTFEEAGIPHIKMSKQLQT
jgi:predicted GNAT family N-acyltransferase